jgi:hypothetical protein
MALAVGHVMVGVAAPTLKPPLVEEMLRGEVSAGFSERVARSVSPLVAPVKMRLLKVATPLVVEAVAGVVVRSALLSVTLTLAEAALRAVPLSVTVTAGAGDIAVPGMVPPDGGSVVKLSA